jgi:aryl-alcohol dehydrogenase
MKTLAAIARRPRSPLSLEEIDLAEPRPDEVVVRVVATGICHTDPAMRDQTFPVPQPVVLGHEGAGIVVDIGAAVSSVRVGDAVLMSYHSCGICPSCRANLPGFCHDFFGHNFASTRADGTTALSQKGEAIYGHFFGQSSFATYALATQRNVLKVDVDLPLDVLCPLGCSIQTGAGAVWNALQVFPGSTFAVFGTGPVGLSALLAAKAVGATRIVAVDPVAARRELARELGATEALDPARVDVVATLRQGADAGIAFALDTTGLPAVIRQATDALAPRGRCAILGASPVGTDLVLDAIHMMTGGRQLVGTVEGNSTPAQLIPRLMTLHQQGRFPWDRMITRYPFAEINQALDDTEHGRCIKAVLMMPET